MKKIIRLSFIYIIALKILAETIPAVNFGENLKTILSVALVLTLFELFIKPLLKILLLPINLLTLGLLRWVVNVVGLYVASSFVSAFAIRPYYFPGLISGNIVIPATQLNSLLTYIFVSFCLDILLIVIRWLVRK